MFMQHTDIIDFAGLQAEGFEPTLSHGFDCFDPLDRKP
jgi:hypothetical protein